MPDDDLDRKLSVRLRAYESAIPDAEPPPPGTSPGRSMLTYAVLGGAVLAIGVAVILGFAILSSQPVQVGDTSPSPSPRASAQAPSATALPSATPPVTEPPPSYAFPTLTATPIPGVAGVSWDQAVAATVDGNISRIATEGSRFYALGSRFTGTDSVAMVWASEDGRTWTPSDPLPHPSKWGSELYGFLAAHELVVVDGRLVAIGTIGINDYLEVVAWESTDGRTWAEIDTGSFRTDGFLVNDIANGPAGIAAVAHGYAPGTGSVWLSRDGGRTWTERIPPGSNITVTAVVGTGGGYVVAGAVNELGAIEGVSESPRIWTSTDGVNWREASLDGGDSHGRVAQVTVDNVGRWVALGILGDRLVTWRSIDGGHWQVTADLGDASDTDPSGLRLAGAPGGFVALNSSVPASVWTSDDGIGWTAAPLPQPMEAGSQIEWSKGIARVGDTVLLAGQSHASGYPREWFVVDGAISR